MQYWLSSEIFFKHEYVFFKENIASAFELKSCLELAKTKLEKEERRTRKEEKEDKKLQKKIEISSDR